MDREILIKTIMESYSPMELATKLVECEEALKNCHEDIRTKDAELMYLRETNFFLKDLVARLTKGGAE